MSRIFSIFILLAFFVWIIPLGAFIKVSQEVKVCGGQRAICLCSINFLPTQSKTIKPILTNSGQVNKESSASGGANREFSVDKFIFNPTIKSEYFLSSDLILTTALFIKAIEHVPKA